MELALRPETERRIRSLIECGRYASPQEVIEDALHRLEHEPGSAIEQIPTEQQAEVQLSQRSGSGEKFISPEPSDLRAGWTEQALNQAIQEGIEAADRGEVFTPEAATDFLDAALNRC